MAHLPFPRGWMSHLKRYVEQNGMYCVGKYLLGLSSSGLQRYDASVRFHLKSGTVEGSNYVSALGDRRRNLENAPFLVLTKYVSKRRYYRLKLYIIIRSFSVFESHLKGRNE
jgi:hypothetical protein